MKKNIVKNMVSRRFGSLLLALCFMLTLIPLTSQPVQAVNYDFEVFVDALNGDNNNTGTDADHAFKTIAYAVDEVESVADLYISPAIHIAAGTYAENLVITESMSLIGASADSTIIDGGNVGRAISISGPDSTAALENLTITKGKAADGEDGVYTSGYEASDGEDGEKGGGIYSTGDLTVTGCIITNNAAGSGGQGSTHVDYTSSGGDGADGGGIYCAGDLTLTDCTITDNTAGSGGDAGDVTFYEYNNTAGNGGSGGGVCCAGTLTVTGTVVASNKTGDGGAGGTRGDGSVNDGTDGGDGGSGGGIWCAGDLTVLCCAVTDNTTGDGGNGGDGGENEEGGSGGNGGDGGGVYCTADINISGNKFASNSTGTGGAAGFSEMSLSGSDGSDGVGSQLCSSPNAAGADNNWWGDNDGPGSGMTNANVTAWLVLRLDAAHQVTVNQQIQILITLNHNNNGESVSNIFDDVVTLSVLYGTFPGSAALTNGAASVAYETAVIGTDTILAALDNESVTADIVASEISIAEDSFPFALGIYKEAALSAVGALGTTTWSATGLPGGLGLDTDTGVISGTPTQTGTYTVTIELTDTRTDSAPTCEKDVTITVYDATGNGAYLVTPVSDAAYTVGMTEELIPTMTVREGVSGFTYFAADISKVLGHSGEETAVFVQLRNGKQVGMSFVKADFENISSIGAGFNVIAGDVIKVYIVDALSNSASDNPEIL